METLAASDARISQLALLTGVIAAGGSALLWFGVPAPGTESPQPRRSTQFVPDVSTGKIGLNFHGNF